MSRVASERDLVRAIRAAYPANEYAVLSQVANSTGTGAGRWADAIALGLWPSRGMPLHGFECKSSRADWKRELENPEKAESIASKCNYWWIVTANDKVALVEELPPPWGLYVIEGTTLRKVKPAAYIENDKPLSRGFVGALLRQAQAQIDEDALRLRIEHECRAQYEETGRAEAYKQFERRLEAANAEVVRLTRLIAQFEKASGVDLGRFRYQDDPARLGQLFEQALYGTAERQRLMVQQQLERLREVVGDAIQTLKGEGHDG